MKISKEIRVAILAIAAFAILILGFRFLKGIDVLNSSNTYYAKYPKLNGLQVSNPVVINGFAVGRVSNISLLQGQNHQLVVQFEVRQDLKLGQGAVANLDTDGLIGGNILRLDVGNLDTPLQSGDTVAGVISPSLVGEVQSRAIPLLERLDTTALIINKILHNIEDQEDKIAAMASNLASATGALKGLLESTSANLESTIANLEVTTKALNDPENGVSGILTKLNNSATNLEKLDFAPTLQTLDSSLVALKAFTQKLNESQGTLGKLIEDDSLYNNLNAAVVSLDSLLMDVKDNPRRYVHFSVFGRKDKK